MESSCNLYMQNQTDLCEVVDSRELQHGANDEQEADEEEVVQSCSMTHTGQRTARL